MLLHLIKKDFLLVNKLMIGMGLFAFIIPLFFLWQAPVMLGGNAFIMMLVMVVFILYQSVSTAELKYPEAQALLCAAPYSRRLLVAARYLFVAILFGYCYLAYSFLAALLPGIDFLQPVSVITAALVLAVIVGVYIPAQHKFGYEKTKYGATIIIMFTCYLLPLLIGSGVSINLDGYFSLPVYIQCTIPLVVTALITFISIKVSIGIFSQKEL